MLPSSRYHVARIAWTGDSPVMRLTGSPFRILASITVIVSLRIGFEPWVIVLIDCAAGEM